MWEYALLVILLLLVYDFSQILWLFFIFAPGPRISGDGPGKAAETRFWSARDDVFCASKYTKENIYFLAKKEKKISIPSTKKNL